MTDDRVAHVMQMQQLRGSSQVKRELVERLRAHTGSVGVGGCQDCYAWLMDDAADRIEALEKVLHLIADSADLDAFTLQDIADVLAPEQDK